MTFMTLYQLNHSTTVEGGTEGSGRGPVQGLNLALDSALLAY
jgi:hypothetical protein